MKTRAAKEQDVVELAEKMKSAKIAIIAHYKGLDVATATEIRKKCRDSKVTYQVVKNTLAKRAAKGTQIEGISDAFQGPVALILGDDPITPAKVMADFAKEHEAKFELRVAVVEGQRIDAKGIVALAKMPGLLELRGMIAGMLAAPAGKLVRLIATPGQQLARALDARREQLSKAG